MSALDLLADDFPHGTKAGFDAGCRGSHCPAGIACRDAAVRYRGDFRFRRLMDEGLTGDEIVAREAESQAYAEAQERAAELARREQRAAERRAEREAAVAQRREDRRAAREAERAARPAPAPRAPRSAVVLSAFQVESARWKARRVELEQAVAVTRSAAEEARDALRDHLAARPKRTVVEAPVVEKPAPKVKPVRAPRVRAPRPERKPRVVQGHGTNASYVRGCRCDECRAAAAAYQLAYKQRRAANGGRGLRTGMVPHGTANGYQLGCHDRAECPGGPDGVTCADASLASEARRRRERGVPERTFVDSEAAREHVRALMAAGLPLRVIAARADVSFSVTKNLIYGHSAGAGFTRPQSGIAPGNAERLLAVQA